jgi:hypothetical protein
LSETVKLPADDNRLQVALVLWFMLLVRYKSQLSLRQSSRMKSGRFAIKLRARA